MKILDQVSSTSQVTIELTKVGERERERDDLLIALSLSTLEESMHQGVMEEVT
jgi:hypothetical protein